MQLAIYQSGGGEISSRISDGQVIEVAEKQSVEALAKQTMKRQLKTTRKPYW